MSLKSAIKKAISENSLKYIATKVWKINVTEDYGSHDTMWIEVSVKKRKKPKKKKRVIPFVDEKDRSKAL